MHGEGGRRAAAQPAGQQKQPLMVEMNEIKPFADLLGEVVAEASCAQELAGEKAIHINITGQARQRAHLRHIGGNAAWNANLSIGLLDGSAASAPYFGGDMVAVDMAQNFEQTARRTAVPAFDIEAEYARYRVGSLIGLIVQSTVSKDRHESGPILNSASTTERLGSKDSRFCG